MANCTFSEDEAAARDAAAKWTSMQQNELMAIQLAAILSANGIDTGEGCEFSSAELELIEDSRKWLSFSQAELIALLLAANTII